MTQRMHQLKCTLDAALKARNNAECWKILREMYDVRKGAA